MFMQRQGRQYYSIAHLAGAEERLTEFNKDRWLGHAQLELDRGDFEIQNTRLIRMIPVNMALKIDKDEFEEIVKSHEVAVNPPPVLKTPIVMTHQAKSLSQRRVVFKNHVADLKKYAMLC